ncbi:MAG: FtsX-like permease family protein, partial [Candidatus Helarchaeota archaeon]
EEFTLKAGRFLSDNDISGAFIGENAANRLKVAVGDKILIYSGLRDVSLQVTIIGIYYAKDDALNNEVIVPLYAGQILSGNYPDLVTYIRVKYNDTLISRQSLEDCLISQHNLQVRTISNETKEPIEGIQTDVYDINGVFLKQGYSDSLGECAFRLDFGNYTIVAHYGESIMNQSVFLNKDIELSIAIEESETLETLHVKVLDENQLGVPYQTVIAWKGLHIAQMRQTNLNGEADFSLSSDIYQISTLFWNNFTREPIEFRQTATPGQNECLIFWYRAFKLGVRAFDPSSDSLLNTIINVKLLNGTVLCTGETGELGYVEFGDLSPTFYNISLHYGAIQQYQLIELRSDRTLNFEVLPQFELQVHVVNDSTRLPINNSYIKLRDSTDNIYEAYTKADGIATFTIKLETYNITVEAGPYVKSRLIQLNSSRMETFLMPNYNFTIIIKNITGHLQDAVNVSLESNSFNSSQLTQEGISTFFVPPDSYTVTFNISNTLLTQTYDVFNTLAPLTFIAPPYNLTIFLLNGTIPNTPPISGINISIYDHSTESLITTALAKDGNVSVLLNPGIYNISANISNGLYYEIFNLTEPSNELTFYSYPFNLTIQIFNGTTDMPQPNLQVRLFDLNQTLIAGPNITDSTGTITYFITPALINISITSGDSAISKIIEVNNPNRIVTYEFPPYNLTIQVFNATNNLPIEGATVEILRFIDNSTLFAKNTSSDGIAQFNLNSGWYYINLTYKAYNSIQFREIATDPLINFPVPPYKLTVQVVDFWDNPIADANVSIDAGAVLKTNSTGYIEFYLDPGIHNVTASWDSLYEEDIVDMSDFSETFLAVIKLVNKVWLNVSVVNAISGRSLINANVKIHNLLGAVIDSAFTDQSGFCHFYLAPQLYNLSVEFEETFEYQLVNLTMAMSVLFSIIPYYKLTILTFDDSGSYYKENVKLQIRELGGVVLAEKFTDSWGECSFKLEYGTYNLSLLTELEQKSEIIDMTQTKSLSFHMAPYKLTITAINTTTFIPIASALVTVNDYSGENLASKETDGLGVADFLMNPGHFFIHLNISGMTQTKELLIMDTNTSLHLIFYVASESYSAIDIGDPTEYSASLLQQTLGLTESVVYVLAIILTILVSFSIMNVVSSSVSESRRYIGIIRSIGGSRRQIYYMVNYRIVIISTISGLLGGLIGILLGSFISMRALEISLSQILTGQFLISLSLMSISITLLIGLISSNLTLYRIMKMPIATSMKEILPTTL